LLRLLLFIAFSHGQRYNAKKATDESQTGLISVTLVIYSMIRIKLNE